MSTLLFLLAGILLIMAVVTCITDRVNIISNLVVSVSTVIVLYAGISFVLLKINQFSVNRSMMAIMGLTFVILLISIVFLKKKPTFQLKYKKQLVPVIYSILFFVITVCIMNGGYYGIHDSIGVNQTKALSLASQLGVSPMEAEYTGKMSMGILNIKVALSEISDAYAQSNDIAAPLMALSAKVFGYTRMMYIFGIMVACAIYLIWMCVCVFKVKKWMRYVIPALCGIIMTVCIALGFSRREVVYKWNTLDNMKDIISAYDVIIVDDSVMDELYIPLAGVIESKTYPLIGDTSEEVADLSLLGECLYYVTDKQMDSDVMLDNGLNMKLVYDSNYYVYRNFSYYGNHSVYDYAVAYSLIYILIFIALGIAGYVVFYSCIFRKFDTVVNVMLSCATFLGIYGMVSAILMIIGIYQISYGVIGTILLGDLSAMLLLAMGKKPEFIYDLKKNVVPSIVCIITLVVAGAVVNYDYYGINNIIGSNQAKALEYIFAVKGVHSNLACNNVITAYLALGGRTLGYERMMYVIPMIIAGIEVIIYTICYKITKRVRISASIEAICMIALVTASGIWFDGQKSCSTWQRIKDYTNIIRMDDAVAIQDDLYNDMHYPIEYITGTQTCIRVADYEEATQAIDNCGNFVYYLTDEVLDVNHDRVKVLVNKENYLYQCYPYNTKLGIYAVSDSVNKGFYSPELSGMAWSKKEIVYVQCNIMPGEYDTVRLYLGTSIDFDRLHIDEVELEFRENGTFISRDYINRDNNGRYIDFPINNGFIGSSGVNTIYFRCSVSWSPVMYGVKDSRMMGFPYYYIQFLNTAKDITE